MAARTVLAPTAEAQAEEHVHSHNGPGAHFVVARPYRACRDTFIQPCGNTFRRAFKMRAIAGGVGEFGLVDDPVEFLALACKGEEGGKGLALALRAQTAGREREPLPPA